MAEEFKYVGPAFDPSAPSMMMQGKLKPPIKYVVTCPKCGSPDVTVDATGRWDVENQEWSLSSTFDRKTCGSCLYESDSFHDTPQDQLNPVQKAFVDGEISDYNPVT